MNLWWVALLSFGEGWHNNHHAFPRSARHGLRWWELDVTYGFICIMGWLGLARKIHVPDERSRRASHKLPTGHDALRRPSARSSGLIALHGARDPKGVQV